MDDTNSLTENRELARFFELSLDMLCIAGFDGYFKRLNLAWEKTLGFSIEELIARPYLDFVHPEDRDRTLAEAQKLTTGRDTISFENRYRCKDSSYRWLLWSATPLVEPQQIYAIARDITDRKQTEDALRSAHEELELQVRERTAELLAANGALNAEMDKRKQGEEALRQANQTLRSVVEASPQAIIQLDVDRRVRLWNPAAMRIFGWTADEVIGGPLPFVPEGKQEEFLALSERALRGESFSNVEVRRQRRDGSPVDLLASCAPLHDSTGSVCGYVAVAADITERKKLEQHFLRAQRMESIGSLAGGIAHDLNNVLAPILMAVQFLRERFTDEQSQRMLATVESSVKRGADLVKQVLTFARGIEGQHMALQPKHLIRETSKILEETIARSIRIVTDIPKGLWTVSGDATQLSQVLMNLCLNSRDAMPGGGTLKISAQNVLLDETYATMHPEAKAGPYVGFEVSDTGKGIPAEFLDKIFEPFFTTKEIGKGTGLGLSTVAAIVKSHDGFVSVHSDENGTTFKVYLPAISTEETRRGEEEQLRLPTGNGELVLIVDDEAAVHDVAKATLEAYGYRVLVATDGAEGLALFAQHKDDVKVVLSDMNMPLLDGQAMIRSLERINPGVRVVCASGLLQNAGGGHQTPTTGVVRAFLQKPFTAEQLLRTLHEVLATS